MDASHPLTTAELAQRLGLELRGDPAVRLRGVGSLEGAGPDELAFLSSPQYRARLAATRAGAVLLREEDAAGHVGTVILARDPYAAYARAAALFHPRAVARPGIHPAAVVHPEAEIDPAAEIGPLACIGARSRVAAGAIVGAGCVIGEDCEVGRDCELVARVTLVTRVRLGARVRIHPGAVLGADGFGLAMDGGRWLNVPQLGGVRIGDDCEIGANTTIDRGAIDDTVLEEDVRLDNLIQIAHNVHVGAHTAMAGCVGVAGSARIGRYCMIAGAAGVAGHLEICDHVTVTAMSMVSQSIREPGEYSSGISVMRSRDWRRNAARLRQLDGFARRVIALEREQE
ncbi:UDP-3-O-(3-hydroxymyristoyl)glucosamine N-acyltransferase [Luteimonas sp. SJ-92]|uniref:UDP-3-O-acylglucosamine N-acyltransferase n=1 Tax=Luteimonas salinisoli TaxID=2752307 RepID=A0A853JHL0_9GAMM|nr:UDP-3-O-(3-hydroxymyristoyl)glucosamine N-acyltransferase [Luteimonas salinisoli]NZA28047.1 UDP-3-O-(3-hydroxymyristoyl)glucosamine N-acyltransferase [Luteimonas salinisoli]